MFLGMQDFDFAQIHQIYPKHFCVVFTLYWDLVHFPEWTFDWKPISANSNPKAQKLFWENEMTSFFGQVSRFAFWDAPLIIAEMQSKFMIDDTLMKMKGKSQKQTPIHFNIKAGRLSIWTIVEEMVKKRN